MRQLECLGLDFFTKKKVVSTSYLFPQVVTPNMYQQGTGMKGKQTHTYVYIYIYVIYIYICKYK